MEEKSVEIPKIKGPLREQDSIRALLELLEQQGMEQEKGDVIRMADHIDSMEMQLGTVLKELGEVKKQLGVMQEKEPEGASRSNLKQRKQSRRPETGQ